MHESNITLVFYRSNSLISRLIRAFTYSKTSHVAISFERFNTNLLYQGTVRGVVFDVRNDYEKSTNNKVIAEYKINVPVSKGMSYVINKLNTKYDFIGAAGVGIIKIIKRWFGKKIKNPFASSKAMICSELVTELNHYGEIKGLDGLDPERASPGDILDICERNLYNEFERIK